MKSNSFIHQSKILFCILIFSFSNNVFSQNVSAKNSGDDFWRNVQFGGGLGLSVGNNFTNITVAPSAIYNLNQYVSLGMGLQYSYLKQKNLFTSNMYGGSLIGLVNPIREVQLSVELEQLRVNVNYDDTNFKDNFWNTGLFLGAGYRMENVTIGARYNVLFDKDRNVYGDAFMPFVRVFF
jgi:long-subunit fatty acid transport protein